MGDGSTVFAREANKTKGDSKERPSRTFYQDSAAEPRPTQHGIVLAPVDEQILQAAFDAAWNHLFNNHLLPTVATEMARGILAKHVMELRGAGERDPIRMAARAIVRFTSSRG